jgi:hypothetical protein
MKCGRANRRAARFGSGVWATGARRRTEASHLGASGASASPSHLESSHPRTIAGALLIAESRARVRSRSVAKMPMQNGEVAPSPPGARPSPLAGGLQSGFAATSGLVRRRDPPTPSWHRGVCDRLRPWPRVVDRQPRAPFGVAHDRCAELGISRKVGVIGGAAEQGHERQALFRCDRQVSMASSMCS